MSTIVLQRTCPSPRPRTRAPYVALFAIFSGTVGCLEQNPLLDSGAVEGTDVSTGGGVAPSTSTVSASDATTAFDTALTGQEPEDTSSTAESGTFECEGGTCLPSWPPDWGGPIVFADWRSSTDMSPCPTTFPVDLASLHDQLVAPDAECTCECGDAVGASCADLILEFHGMDENCIGGANDEFDIDASCQEGPSVTSSSRYWSADQPGVIGGSCSPTEATNLPEVSWGIETRVCGVTRDPLGSCVDERTCVPLPPSDSFSNVCIWRPGSFDCPEGEFSERFVRYSSFTDERGCSSCGCDDPEGDCVGNVRLWPTDDCSGGIAAGSIPIGGGCVPSVDSVSSADRGSLSVSGVNCAPEGGEPVGEVLLSEPHTICCAPQ